MSFSLLRPLFWIAALSIGFSCARVGSPTGGDKDTVAPELVKVSPADQTVNFTAKEITFTFNEYVKLNNVQQQLVISPSLEEQPEFRIKKKSIVLVLKSPLSPNTTYNFNFGDAIVDVNESNPLKGFTYVISTGNYLDSLTIGGIVLNAYNGKVQKDFTAMLYDTSATDSTPYLKKPLYITKTNDKGAFVLKNIKAGKYQLLALNDLNKDYKFQTNEEIAFSDSLIIPNSDSTFSNSLASFKEVPDKLILTSKKLEEQKKLIVGINRSCTSCALVEPPGQSLIYTQWKDANQDSLFARLKPINDLDSITFYLSHDSLVIDTVQFYPAKGKKKQEGTRKFFALIGLPTIDANDFVRVSFIEPIVNLEASVPVRIMKTDSTVFAAKLVMDSVNPEQFYLDFTPVFEEKYTIYWPDSTFFGLYGNYSRADTMKVEVQKAEFYGNLSFNINNKLADPAILLFTNDKTANVKMVKLAPGINKVEFMQLTPSLFSVAVIIDKNGNGVWDTGKYLLHRQAEKVINYKELVQIRSNWDLELDWILQDSDGK